MMRFALAAVAILLNVGVAAAQDAAAPGRSQMKANGDAIGVLVAMVKGDKPYDQAAVDAALAKFEECVRKLPTLYPESLRGVQTDARYSPSAKIWDDKAGFADQISGFGSAVATARSTTTNVDSLKASVDAIGKQCGNCHQTYRIRNG